MRHRQESTKKRPSGGRPVPRRLFSFDSLRKEKSNIEGEDFASDVSTSTSQTPLSEKPILELPDSQNVEDKHWTETPFVASPEPQDEANGYVSAVRAYKSKPTLRPAPLDFDKDSTTADNASITSAALASPSKRRWDTVRHHVLPSISSSIDSASDILAFPPRPSTPKGYKFGQKKAFRQVVETAQTQQQGESKRFAEAIRLACWEVRFGETPQQVKAESTLGSTLHLPFALSTASLPTNSAASILATGTRVHGLRRPPSISSVIPSAREPPSITRLARALTSSMSFNRPQDLPHEKLVLSTLLIPFLSPLPGTTLEIEQATAVETFEYAIRTWKPHSSGDDLERCIWCCKAASVFSPSRVRILGTLSSILFSRDKTFIVESPAVLQSLLQGLFTLAYTLSLSPRSAAEYQSVMGYISAICSGSCGPLSQSAVESEYGVRYTKNDSDDLLMEVLVTESVIRCLAAGPDHERRWVLRMLLQDYWPMAGIFATPTPLYACAQWRKLGIFLPAACELVSSTSDKDQDYDITATILRTRILPELDRVREEDASQIRRGVVRLSLELLSKQHREQGSFTSSQLCNWLRDEPVWKADFETTLQEIIKEESWHTILRVIPDFVMQLPDQLQGPTLSLVLPSINNRISGDPPELPSPALSRFLNVVSRTHPKIFFRPLFSCAAAHKDATVIQQLKILNAISRLIPDFWTRDADMMSIALTSIVTVPKASSTSDIRASNKARIGQLALILEVLERIRLAGSSKDLSEMTAINKFATCLEARLGMIIESRERTTPIVPSQRLLLCSLFRQIRLLSRSTKPADWLRCVVDWVISWSSKDTYTEDCLSAEAVKLEAATAFHQLQEVYRATQKNDEVLSPKRKSGTLHITLLERQVSEQSSSHDHWDEGLKSRLDFLVRVSRSFEGPFLSLLVTMSGMLTVDDHICLGPAIWKIRLSEANAEVLAPTCFLLMQFAEKCPDGFIETVEKDLGSVKTASRRRALEQMSMLSTWRFQLLTQEVILDRNHRRPFKLQRPPVLFVATDIGSSTFVYEDDTEEYKDTNGHVIPSELRRRLSEIGWAQEDRIIDHRLQRIRTPMTLLPSQQLDKIDDSTDSIAVIEPPSPNASPEPSPTKSGGTSLVRQESIVGGRSGAKRKPVFVPALLSLFPKVATLINDADFIVADAARTLIVDFMRDEPTLLSRHVFQTITGDGNSLDQAITTLRLFSHVKHLLPPSMSHHVLNHLAGLLKASARHSEGLDPLRSYAYVLPSIAKLFPQVNKASLRDLRRNKVDTFLIPSGSLWFPTTAPAGSMFPRSLPAQSNPFETLPPSLVCMVMIRTSQNLLFVSILHRNPQDLKILRKNISSFQLPSLSRSGVDQNLSLKSMLPERQSSADYRTAADTSILALSITLARSYLLLIQQIFQCMSRHLNDRTELAILMDGLNRILLTHKDDIGIVARVMLAYMTAATRFKRLFISGGGYMLFMPAVTKVFIEADQQPQVRQAIAYAAQRFYTLHQESFVFQSFDALGPILSYALPENAWVADGLATLFMSLRPGAPNPISNAAGILDMNKEQEQEALMVTMAEEVPQTFFASLKRGRTNQDKDPVSFHVLEGYETKRLKMDDLVRLLLTVIAHNPGIQRAEHFLIFLRALTPQLYGVSRSVQTVLRSGVDALGGILLTRATGRQKGTDIQPEQATEQSSYETMANNAPSTQNSNPSSLINMRLEYFRLVVAFSAAGGQITPTTTGRVVELVRTVLKESHTSAIKVAQFLSDLTRALLIRSVPRDVKEVVAYLASFAPLCTSYIGILDLSDMYFILHEVASNPVYASDVAFARLITQYCDIGLGACEKSASENLLFTFPLRTLLVKLLVDVLTMDGADIITELRKRNLTHNFLAGIVLPVVLTLRTSGDIVAESRWAERGRCEIFSRTWLQLLTLALSVCEKNIHRHPDKSPSLPPVDRHKSTEQNDSIIPSSVKSLSIALQIVKVIVIRAEEDISTASRDIWVQLGNQIKSLLAEGDAMFALRIRDYSEPPSPALSPRTSTFGESQQNLFAFPSSVSMHGRATFNSPRMIDYLAWSVIEWCWLRRSPLMIQMRIFAQERIANLATELRLQGTTPLVSSLRSGGRRFSSVFSKPRRSMHSPSAPSSTASTPRNSTHLGGSASFPQMSDPLSTSSTLTPSRSVDGRQAGYARMPSPISPSGRTSQDSVGLKIVHLGPVDSSLGPNLSRTLSSTTDTTESRGVSAKHLAKDVFVASHFLTRMTYRRIRLVQHLMGYSSALLPMPGSDYISDGGLDAEPSAWSKNEALQAVVDETRELLDEFNDDFGALGDESLVMVDSVPSISSFHNS
ncbi:hypothetical protein BDY19DRAFT_893157 [Irpex rosettiformis]|uniref:Uncharacterized protein n=1 Tax=Irpex rosettiformis TaxID=378272 RepID=A0ACB8TZ86_9APHY|nr:hypothetical protein BDY19DRAFT_893157 [Irpex rosettiformis]